MREWSRWRTSLILAAVYGLALTCEAEPGSARLLRCRNPQTQSSMNESASRGARQADAKLNETYRRVLATLNPTAKQKLVLAQRAWIAFRDAELAAEWPVGKGETAQVLYGSVFGMCVANRYEELTAARTEQLRRLLKSEEGDVCQPGLALQGKN